MDLTHKRTKPQQKKTNKDMNTKTKRKPLFSVRSEGFYSGFLVIFGVISGSFRGFFSVFLRSFFRHFYGMFFG